MNAHAHGWIGGPEVLAQCGSIVRAQHDQRLHAAPERVDDGQRGQYIAATSAGLITAAMTSAHLLFW